MCRAFFDNKNTFSAGVFFHLESELLGRDGAAEADAAATDHCVARAESLVSERAFKSRAGVTP